MNASVKMTNASVVVKNAAGIDKKRFGWLLSPGLPVIGMGILAGYHFGPKPTKKIFALGGPLLLHVIIPAVDGLVGADENNPSDDEIKVLVNDPYYDRIEIVHSATNGSQFVCRLCGDSPKCIDARPNIIGHLYGGN